MQVTIIEFKMNPDKYFDLILTEDIWVTKSRKTVTKLIDPNISAMIPSPAPCRKGFPGS